jgi:hypothetical protein
MELVGNSKVTALEKPCPPEPVQFAFALNQSVIIKGPKIEANVIAQVNSQRGEMYEIVFWTSQGQRCVTMVMHFEIRAKD